MNERFNWKIFIHIFFDLHRSKFHINFEISQFKNHFVYIRTLILCSLSDNFSIHPD